MKPVKLETSKAPQPGGWYSQAFRVGNLIYTAGITAHDPVTGELVASGDIAGQTRQILRNMKGILEDHGSDLEHVFKTLVFVADIDQFSRFNEAYKEFFPEDPPARSTMQVGKFNHGMVIEIEAIAAVKE
ncbi:MAG: RidA family protein [Lachnospiraceae bacterium]|jgi:2-iminobutanoate/2-iminopropanoate deaminase|nr:RidA family protein [Lachnospiraceae bacterium]MCI8958160.1 RidA family protein [Lachnospiraceae bacterium]